MGAKIALRGCSERDLQRFFKNYARNAVAFIFQRHNIESGADIEQQHTAPAVEGFGAHGMVTGGAAPVVLGGHELGADALCAGFGQHAAEPGVEHACFSGVAEFEAEGAFLRIAEELNRHAGLCAQALADFLIVGGIKNCAVERADRFTELFGERGGMGGDGHGMFFVLFPKIPIFVLK